MAHLIACQGCGKQISSELGTCIHCGFILVQQYGECMFCGEPYSLYRDLPKDLPSNFCFSGHVECIMKLVGESVECHLCGAAIGTVPDIQGRLRAILEDYHREPVLQCRACGHTQRFIGCPLCYKWCDEQKSVHDACRTAWEKRTAHAQENERRARAEAARKRRTKTILVLVLVAVALVLLYKAGSCAIETIFRDVWN